jgi:2'-5' RNA ligase
MRVFFGVELADEVKAWAAEVSARLRRRVEKAPPRAVIRWVDPENLHVTLWFVGEVTDERFEALTAATHAPYPTDAFRLGLSGTGAFPPSGAPRVLWIGLTAGVDHLRSLYAELARRLAPLGLEPERREYSPHLTIARIKDVQRRDALAVRNAVATPTDVFVTGVSAVTLFRSRLSPKGARYEALLRVPLS